METKLNIAEILKEKSGTPRLYSLIHGELTLERIAHGDNSICAKDRFGTDVSFRENGHYYNDFNNDGECLIFPSKEMRDWEKFAWKRGDILSCGDSTLVFKEWADDDYTRFWGIHKIVMQEEIIGQYIDTETDCATSEYNKVADSKNVEQYLRNVEYNTGGKLNLETLEIEKPTFKDGDIVFFDLKANGGTIAIFKEFAKDGPMVYASYFIESDCMFSNPVSCLCLKKNINKKRLATAKERELILSKLANIGKKWNPGAKQIEDLPKQHEFKPFDKVLVRDYDSGEWYANIFSHIDKSDEYRFNCIQGCWQFCIPYEGNEHLLGTTNDPNQ